MIQPFIFMIEVWIILVMFWDLFGFNLASIYFINILNLNMADITADETDHKITIFSSIGFFLSLFPSNYELIINDTLLSSH